MKYRPLCIVCGKKPAAVNYRKGDSVYFRRRCDSCIRKKRGLKTQTPNWTSAGYKKKPHCEKCGFKAQYKEQLFVYHVDGNLNNTAYGNLRTVCANCQIEIARSRLGWIQGDLIPDL